jgi:hypothetical protein
MKGGWGFGSRRREVKDKGVCDLVGLLIAEFFSEVFRDAGIISGKSGRIFCVCHHPLKIFSLKIF